MQSSCSSLCKKCSTSAARFFGAAAGEPLLGMVYSILGLTKPFWGLAKAYGLLASLFTATSNLGSRSSHLSLIVHPELEDSLFSLKVRLLA